MALSNYTELLTAVQDRMHRSDLSGEAPDYVRLAEGMLNRRIRHYKMESSAVLSLLEAGITVALPADFQSVIQLAYALNGDIILLEPGSSAQVPPLQQLTETGAPSYYRITGSLIRFDVFANIEYSLTLAYRVKLDLAAATTNWLLADYPDLYFNAALSEAHESVGGDRGDAYRQKVDIAIAEINSLDSAFRDRPRLVVDALRVSEPFNIFNA